MPSDATLSSMYAGIDVGGTKTLVASLDENGVITEQLRFETPRDYQKFLAQLALHLSRLAVKDFKACGVGIPGIVDNRGHGLDFGNLPWRDVPVQTDVERLIHCPIALANDAKLAGLSEAMLVKDKHRVLYVTVSTGIGTGYIVGQHIDPDLATNEGGHLLLEHDGRYMRWQDFASGSAIYKRYGKRLSDINDARTLRVIARNIAIGLIDLIAILTPDVVILGGSVGTHYPKYGTYLDEFLKRYDNPMIQLPDIKAAERPEQAVVYGCYDYAKQLYG